MTELYNPWPKVIQRIRLRKGLTQEQAAEVADVSANTWYRSEKAGFIPSEKQLEKILKGLGVSADELGAEFALSIAKRYLPLSEDELSEDDDGNEPPLESERPPGTEPPSPSGVDRPLDTEPSREDFATDGYEDLLSPRWLEHEPEDLESLIRGTLGKSFTVVAAIISILSELISSWPRFRNEASEEDQRHVLLLRSHLHQLLDSCLTISEELQEIASSRNIPVRSPSPSLDGI